MDIQQYNLDFDNCKTIQFPDQSGLEIRTESRSLMMEEQRLNIFKDDLECVL